MFAKSGFEPIQYGGELNKSEKCDCEFIVASAQTPVTFYSTKEVFDAVAPVIQPAAERSSPGAIFSSGDASFSTDKTHAFPQGISVEAFVTYQGAAPQQAKMWFDRLNLTALPWLKTQRNSVAVAVDQRGQLCVESPLGETDPLIQLPTDRIGTVLVKLDVG